jgi:DNA adenine methylase
LTVKKIDKITPAKTYERLECERATATPRPFLKWVGGKTQLLPELIARIPNQIDRYFEPFIGGGAFFFYLQPKRATIVDINQELINTYRVIKEKPEELIEDLKQHIYSKEYYYQIRNIDRAIEYQLWSDVQKASRLIYLNKTCFNGLYRVNRSGQFNTPIGKYKNPKIVDETNLRACSQVLQNTKIIHGSFLQIEQQVETFNKMSVQKNDFVYFDPPYAPLNATSNFTGYSQNGFDESMQLSLRNLCLRLTAKNVRFMLSNSNAPLILDLYRDFKIEFVYAARAINSQADKRGKIPEVIITNYSKKQ